jgi:predicted enzyme related to lactoylglutathione lyase
VRVKLPAARLDQPAERILVTVARSLEELALGNGRSLGLHPQHSRPPPLSKLIAGDEFSAPRRSFVTMAIAAKPLVHLELHTRDSARAAAFYRELLGWHSEVISKGECSYTALELGAALPGGMIECEVGQPLWLPYVECEDAAALTERARELGAAVLLEPREGPAGRRAVVTTPEAGDVALWEPK